MDTYAEEKKHRHTYIDTRMHAYMQIQIDKLREKYPVFTHEELSNFHTEFETYDLDGSGDINAFEIMQIFR
jgi:hypothetical protein